MTSPAPRPRPGGRSGRVRRAVHEACLALLEQRGNRDLTVPEIAARAGVHATSIYRRWGSVERIVVEALLERSEERLPVPDTGSLVEDLTRFAAEVIAYVHDPMAATLMRTLAATADDPSLERARREFWESRTVAAGVMVSRAVARGEVPADTDAARVLETLIAPIHFRLLLSHGPLDDALPARLAQAAVAAVDSAGAPLD
ncbi:TetR/AcrR family transcriptional regulator [Streptomyces sp. M54]|uniref:TetR/AcrR family transcriptional regulator n=1 Tax=Streptomyces sp. M54 TaxID=2759525 RepID=UPI001FB09210|nr:TetR/AcrR family transcriptional regulator [Streptomyces sp. M54]